MNKFTETPWERLISDENNAYINHALRCAQHHDELVEALRGCLFEMEFYLLPHEDTKSANHEPDDVERKIARARALLAKVEESA